MPRSGNARGPSSIRCSRRMPSPRGRFHRLPSAAAAVRIPISGVGLWRPPPRLAIFPPLPEFYRFEVSGRRQSAVKQVTSPTALALCRRGCSRITMPIVPYAQNGVGQVPLRGSLPSLYSAESISPHTLPTYPTAAAYSSSLPQDTPIPAPDAPLDYALPTIDIPIDHPSHEQASGQAPTSPTSSVGGSFNESELQMKGRKPAIAAAGTFLSLFTFSQLYQNILFEKITPASERAEEKSWVASSHSWLDRRVCNWFGFCGLAHLNKSRWTTKKQSPASTGQDEREPKLNLTSFWEDATVNPEDWSEDERILREIPEYVLEHAPYIHLFSGEKFWPCDVADHLFHTTPHINYTAIQAVDDHPNLTHLNQLNRWTRFVYLQSDDNVEDRPEWLGGKPNIPNTPDESDPDNWADWEDRAGGKYREDKNAEKEDWFDSGIGDTKDRGGIRTATSTGPLYVPTKTPEGEQLRDENEDYTQWHPELARRYMGKKVVGGRSEAPAVLIVVEKDDGVVDAFWFFFYSYNLGNTVFNVRFGNHVGDWEHTVVRFQHGEPKAVFFSEHSFGEAYSWEAVEKIGKRPVGYSATGTHAMYGTPGLHPYVLPGGILHDETDRGPLWDPTLNLYSYTYDYQQDTLRSSNLNPKAPIGWFYFWGHWGDKFYPLNDPRQYRFLGQYHYVDGPLGPRFKNLGRKNICQGNDVCHLETWASSKRPRRFKRYPHLGEGEQMSEEDIRRFVDPELDTTT